MFNHLPLNKLLTLGICLGLTLSACSKKDDDAKKTPAPTLVSTVTAQTTNLEIREEAVGTIEGLMDPTVAAEVAARVTKVLANPGQKVRKGELIVLLDATDYRLQRAEAQAEVARLQALLSNQGRLVERNQALVQKKLHLKKCAGRPHYPASRIEGAVGRCAFPAR